MYADDLTIYASAFRDNELNRVLNVELQAVVKWITNNKLVLNVSKIALYLVQITLLVGTQF